MRKHWAPPEPNAWLMSGTMNIESLREPKPIFMNLNCI